MTEAPPGEEATLFPKTAGERLREAREGQGLSLAEIAARTRIPLRQLEAIETSNFAMLPSITYSVGFAKAYARAVGADEVEIAKEVRSQNSQVRRPEYEAYELPDPSRTPTTGLALAGLAVAVLLLIGVGLWYGTTWFRGGEDVAAAPATVEASAPVAVRQPIAPPPTSSGQVTLTATDDVWMRVYDATGKTLFQDTLKPGARYDVPRDANGPMINVGRPDQLRVTLNGSTVPPLGDGRLAIKDVGISAAALTARARGSVPVAAPSATPSPTSTPTPTPTATSSVGRAERQPDRPRPRATASAAVPVVASPPASKATATPAPEAIVAP